AVVDVVPNLATRTGAADIVTMLEQPKREHGRIPAVLVIDTLTAATAGTDQADIAAMGALFAVIGEIRRRFGVAIVVIHHLRKPPNDRDQRPDLHALLGSIAIAGTADAVLLAWRKKGEDTRVLHAEKVRDGEDGIDVGHYIIHGQETGRVRDNGRADRWRGSATRIHAAIQGPRESARVRANHGRTELRSRR